MTWPGAPKFSASVTVGVRVPVPVMVSLSVCSDTGTVRDTVAAADAVPKPVLTPPPRRRRQRRDDDGRHDDEDPRRYRCQAYAHYRLPFPGCGQKRKRRDPGTLCAVYDSPGKRLRSLGEPAWRGAGPWSIPFHDRRKGGADPVFGASAPLSPPAADRG
ncbi:hypothetical protein GCM10023068_44290 [Leifsonia shinshuensis]